MAGRSQLDASSCPVMEDWNRADLYVGLLNAALTDLAVNGGVVAAVEAQGWSRDRVAGVADRLAALRTRIEVELSRLEGCKSD